MKVKEKPVSKIFRVGYKAVRERERELEQIKQEYLEKAYPDWHMISVLEKYCISW